MADGKTTPGASDSATWTVGIAASAGGIEALSLMLSALPAGDGIACIVAQHLSPDRASLLTHLLSREASLTVLEAADGAPVLAEHVYVCPPGRDILVKDRHIVLADPISRPGTPHPSADRLFASLAADAGDKAVAVVLSGTGGDGSYGIKAVREFGGITIVQDPSTARHDGMPNAAVASGCIDVVLPAGEIGERLPAILSDVRRFGNQPERGDTLNELLTLLMTRTHVDFRDYKESTLTRRVHRRMVACGMSSLRDYIALCRDSSQEVSELFRNLLISVTRFFRDPEEFEVVQAAISERVREDPDRPLRVWVAGCATGEEVYSLAACIAEALGGLNAMTRDRIQIFATDIDREALRQARAGRYPAGAAGDIPRHYLERYFTFEGPDLLPRAPLRQSILFSRHNVFSDAPFINIDLVALRNVLIYFKPTLQDRTESRLHFSLRDDGLMFLGKAERPVSSATRFQPYGPHGHLYAKRTHFARQGPWQKIAPGMLMPASQSLATSTLRGSTNGSETDTLFRALVRQMGNRAILVEDGGEIVSVFGDLSGLITLSDGARPRTDLSLLRPPLSNDAQSLVLLAQKRGERCNGNWRDWPGDDQHQLRLAALPLSLGDEGMRFSLVIIERAERRTNDKPADQDAGATDAELRAELTLTREMLQQATEELQTTNEELQSANHELQAANEELHAANEEQATANEELSATNEELITVNEELQVSGSELSRRTSELTAVLDSAPFKVIVVDTGLRITSLSRMAVEIFDLDKPNLIGAHLGLVLLPPAYPDVVSIASRVLRTRESEEQTFEDGPFAVSMRCAPWINSVDHVSGVVLVFNRFDMTDTRRMIAEREALRECVERMQDISHFRYDLASGRLDWSERVFLIHGIPREEGEPTIEEAIGYYHPDDRPRVEQAVEHAVQSGENYNFIARLIRRDGKVVTVEAHGAPIADPGGGRVVGLVGVFRELS